MSRNPFEDLCHAIDPKGTLHTVVTRTYRDKLAQAFRRFSGETVQHSSPKAFFEAIGYVGVKKRECDKAYRRWKQATMIPDGVRLISTEPFRVTLTS